ncbi:MAG: DUF1330 domain-containing protein [Acidobacteriota bacterium]|nr:DUF1330 domain-containing protein [Acidobacteriota bacterium]
MRKVVVLLAVLAMAWGAKALLAQTPPAYMVVKVTVTDQDAYGEYRAGFGAVFQQYDGEIIAASSDPTVLEGEWEATTTVIIRFASRAEALEWYNSDGYQKLIGVRQSASTADFILVDGR